jgi:hypothetical protein
MPYGIALFSEIRIVLEWGKKTIDDSVNLLRGAQPHEM